MRTYYIALIFLTATLFSCKKENKENYLTDDTCVEWKKVTVTDHSGYTINNSNIQIINTLFSANNIDKSRYRYYYYSNDSVQTYFPPYARFDQKIVRIKEFTNGLEIFTGHILFHFKNNVFDLQNGNPTNGTPLSTTSNLTVQQVRTLFLGHIEQFDQRGDFYRDSCFCAEFGYFDLNAGISNAPENLIKSWKITLKNKIYPFEIPIAYYQDDDAKLIYYDNGIRTFR